MVKKLEKSTQQPNAARAGSVLPAVSQLLHGARAKHPELPLEARRRRKGATQVQDAAASATGGCLTGREPGTCWILLERHPSIWWIRAWGTPAAVLICAPFLSSAVLFPVEATAFRADSGRSAYTRVALQCPGRPVELRPRSLPQEVSPGSGAWSSDSFMSGLSRLPLWLF